MIDIAARPVVFARTRLDTKYHIGRTLICKAFFGAFFG